MQHRWNRFQVKLLCHGFFFADFKLMPLFSQNDIEPFNGFHICNTMYIHIIYIYYIYIYYLYNIYIYYVYIHIVHIIYIPILYIFVSIFYLFIYCTYAYIYRYIHVALIRKLRWKPLARWVAMATSAMEASYYRTMGMSGDVISKKLLEPGSLPLFQPEEWAVLGISQ